MKNLSPPPMTSSTSIDTSPSFLSRTKTVGEGATATEVRESDNDDEKSNNRDGRPQTNKNARKELEFDRISQQVRNFREKEEHRIADEKVREARRIAIEKELERERIAQTYLLEKQHHNQQQQQFQIDNNIHDGTIAAASPGKVAQRTEWLRRLEEENSLTRKQQHQPNTTTACHATNLDDSSFDDSKDSQPNDQSAQVEEEVVRGVSNSENKNDILHDHDVHHSYEFEEVSKLRDQAVAIDNIDQNVESKFLQSSEDLDGKFKKIQNDRKTEIVTQPLDLQSQPNVLQYGIEVDPKTQAMLAEDDFVTPGKNDNNIIPSGSGLKDDPRFNSARNKNNLVLNSFPVDERSRRSRRRRSSNSGDNDDSNIELVHKEASFEIPMEITNGGLKLSPKVADLTMTTTIPPSRYGGRVSGVLEGRSSLGKSNTASGSATLEYKSSRQSRLMLGMCRGCEPSYPLITVGGRLLRRGSSFGMMFYQNANVLLHQQSLWSLSFRHCFPHSKWCFSSQLSRHKDLSFSLTNKKISSLLGWNLFKPNQFHVRFDAHPKLSDYRRAHLYCQWKFGVWNFGISLIQSLHSQIATVGLGLRLFSTRGLEWIISWSRGNAVIRIPIVISKGFAANSSIVQTIYFSVVSYVIQQYIAELWGWIGDENLSEEVEVSMAVRAQNLTKVRRDAAIQIELMTRQARRKTKEETERDGLIIKEAIYKIKNGDEWNVTIPLQFWVSRSTLTLPARRKSELLGFYDISTSLKSSKSLPVNSSNRTVRLFSLSDVLDDIFNWTPKDVLLRQKAAAELPSPILTVSYEFKGQLHQINIKDREELRLPHLI